MIAEIELYHLLSHADGCFSIVFDFTNAGPEIFLNAKHLFKNTVGMDIKSMPTRNHFVLTGEWYTLCVCVFINSNVNLTPLIFDVCACNFPPHNKAIPNSNISQHVHHQVVCHCSDVTCSLPDRRLASVADGGYLRQRWGTGGGCEVPWKTDEKRAPWLPCVQCAADFVHSRCYKSFPLYLLGYDEGVNVSCFLHHYIIALYLYIQWNLSFLFSGHNSVFKF